MLKKIIILFIAFLGTLWLSILTETGAFGFIFWAGLFMLVFFTLFAYYEWSLAHEQEKRRKR